MIVELEQARAWSAEVRQAGAELRVLSGRVWVTQEGDGEDHVLEAGSTFLTDRAGRVAVQSLTRARVQVELPHRLHEPLRAVAA